MYDLERGIVLYPAAEDVISNSGRLGRGGQIIVGGDN